MLLAPFLTLCVVMPLAAKVVIQCPPDTDGVDTDGDGDPNNDVVCMHLAAGDGFCTMADGSVQYIFGFADVTGVDPDMVMHEGMLAANFSGPTIALKEGQQFYLTLTNVGMMMRPDLFDPHTVHFHGFPNASSVFDGEPMASIAINMGSSLTYYYNIVEPGTYMYHCHVEATEHMQMGMLANLYVQPKQNMLPDGTNLNGFTHHAGYKYAYNDGNGSTYYDVEFPVQLVAFDPDFHDADLNFQPLPFAQMRDLYPMINGRGYPDTINPNPLPAPEETGKVSQKISALVTANQGQKILLRISSLATVDFYTVTVLGIPMRVVGMCARQLRGPDGKDTSYASQSITLGGGQSADVILDTSSVPPGTYFLYTTNVNNLCNDTQNYGGMMTEIRIN
jgi:FtsP/CotA-like multicopper oxidase with cupredoxin domain